MNMTERAKLGGAVAHARRVEKHRALRDLLEREGLNLKRAAHAVGWSYRSARRWHRQDVQP